MFVRFYSTVRCLYVFIPSEAQSTRKLKIAVCQVFSAVVFLLNQPRRKNWTELNIIWLACLFLPKNLKKAVNGFGLRDFNEPPCSSYLRPHEPHIGNCIEEAFCGAVTVSEFGRGLIFKIEKHVHGAVLFCPTNSFFSTGTVWYKVVIPVVCREARTSLTFFLFRLIMTREKNHSHFLSCFVWTFSVSKVDLSKQNWFGLINDYWSVQWKQRLSRQNHWGRRCCFTRSTIVRTVVTR